MRVATRAFTLVELLVAMAVLAVLLVLLLGISQAMLGSFQTLRSDRTVERESMLAAARLASDLEVLMPGSIKGETLRITMEAVETRTVPWFTFVAAAPDTDPGGNPGAPRGISYRVAYQDPIRPTGTNPRFGLYRAIASAEDTFESALAQTNQQIGFWTGAPQRTRNRFDLIADYLLDLQVRFQRVDDGTWIDLSDTGDYLRIEGSRTFVKNGTGDETEIPGGVGSIEFTLTILSDKGSQLLEQGLISREEAVRSHSRSFSRRTKILALTL